MKNKKSEPLKNKNEIESCRSAGHVTPEADLTWLLHRAAQRMRTAMGEQVESHGIDFRGYLVLTALGIPEQRTQLALGQALSLDKTTLTSLLDKLEKQALVIRRSNPTDRRAWIPEATEAGRELQKKVALALAQTETALLEKFSPAEQKAFRVMLCGLIGKENGEDTGSCV
jgi:DNA-binding MarR family transcriptional regulator